MPMIEQGIVAETAARAAFTRSNPIKAIVRALKRVSGSLLTISQFDGAYEAGETLGQDMRLMRDVVLENGDADDIREVVNIEADFWIGRHSLEYYLNRMVRVASKSTDSL